MPEGSIDLEFWADSFQEGDWACKELGEYLPIVERAYEKGFIPKYQYCLPDHRILTIRVYGSYRSWSPLPQRIKDLLLWGRPDLVAYLASEDRILFAVEETAAVQTGNQAMQRYERIYGSARFGLPFWYLATEYGLHVDGGVRRDSIWPTVCSLKLTWIKKCPSVILHYSSKTAPEDYGEGIGMENLFEILSHYILWWLDYVDEEAVKPQLAAQYQDMINFLESQWQNVVDYLPGRTTLLSQGTAEAFAQRALGHEVEPLSDELLQWGTTPTLPGHVKARLTGQPLIKSDTLLEAIEELVGKQRAYTLSDRAGSRPQPPKRVQRWINQQRASFDATGLDPPCEFSMALEGFPESDSGLRHVTTAKNILYLCDRWSDVSTAIANAYPRLSHLSERFPSQTPVMLYVSNSICPGRVFGDPYTGQIAAYSVAFTKSMTGNKTRLLVVYIPHQVHSQAFTSRGNLRSNKGLRILKEFADLVIFHGGALLDMSTGEVY